MIRICHCPDFCLILVAMADPSENDSYSQAHIARLTPSSPHMAEVLELGNRNSKTLGFLPEGAYRQHASDGKILIAVGPNGQVLGYLLYSINRRQMLAYIVHLCVKKNHRRKGIARILIDELKRISLEYTGIRARCRRSYKLDGFWQELGFVAAGEREGRGKSKELITIWWYDHGHPTLFTQAWEKNSQSKTKIVVDANVFYDLSKAPDADSIESHSLLADWLGESVVLCLTNEIFNEIIRHPDRAMRRKHRIQVRSFHLVECDLKDYEENYLTTGTARVTNLTCVI